MSNTTLQNDVERVAQHRAEQIELAERVLMKHATEADLTKGAHLVWDRMSADEQFVLGEVRWTGTTVGAEFVNQLHRVVDVVRRKKIAGTPADREKAAARLTLAESELNKREDKLSTQIEKLEAELARLHRAVDESQAEVTVRAAAVARLRLLAPPHVAEQHKRAVAALGRRERAGEDVSREREEAEMLDYYAR